MNAGSASTRSTSGGILRVALLATLLAFAAAGCSRETTAPLPSLGAQADQTSVSGISSGAYMAGQFELAYSESVVGAAIIAGGPWGCAESAFAGMVPGPGSAFLNLSKAINGCMQNALMIWGVPDPRALAEKARRMADEGRIGPIDKVVPDRLYLFAGTEDRTVVPPIVRTAHEFYAKLGVLPSHIEMIDTMPAGHAFLTEDEGLACDRTGSPYIVDCDYDQAGKLLTHIYGPLALRSKQASGTLITFDQRPFTDGLGDHGMAETGYVYVPEACAAAAGCRIHIAFHGCAQSAGQVGEAFVRDTGFFRWADTNRLVVLYPQVAASTFNPQGCWDWWGYTGPDYLSRDAPQLKAVHRMVETLARSRDAT